VEAAYSTPEEAASQKAQGARRNVLLNLRGYQACPRRDLQLYKHTRKPSPKAV